MALNDFFQDSPNYVNPDYVTDAQRKQQRAYAEMLMKRSSGDITRPTGAIANIIDALTGRLEMNRAGNLEQQALGSQNKNITDYATALMGGQQASQTAAPTGSSVGMTAPMGNVADAILPPVTAPTNAARAEVPSSPKVWGDKEAEAAGLYEKPTQVASLGPAGGSAPSGGAQAQPSVLPTGVAPAANQRVAQAFDPALIGRMSTNQMATPEQRALVEGLMQRKLTEDVYGNPAEVSIMGGARNLPQGAGYTAGVRAPTSISPTGVSGTSILPAPQPGTSGPSGLQLGQGGVKGAMDTMNVLGANAARSGAINEFQKQDLQAANDAPTIKRVAGIMLDDLRTSGDKMTFGPTAEWTNNVKKIAANYTPGLMKDQLEAIASADSFDKMSAQLTSLLARGGGTDAQLFNNMRSVPGSHNSKEGAEALLKMTMQVADQQQALARATAGATDPQSYQTAKEKFYRENPVINPITNNPIAQDLQGQKQILQNSSGPVRVNSPEEARKLPKGTKITLPDGSQGVVP